MRTQMPETVSSTEGYVRESLGRRKLWLRILNLILASLLISMGCIASAAPYDRQGLLPSEENAPVQAKVSPALGILPGDGSIRWMENGGRVPLGDGEAMEVFLVPYPPEVQTELHLFVMKEGSYEPVTNVIVPMEYQMVDMDHGDSGKQFGRQVRAGEYVFNLLFFMDGSYTVSVTISWPDRQQLKQQNIDLRVIYRF